MAGRALPAVCGGGVFVFVGPEGENGGGGFLAEYDSNSGGSINVFGEGTNPITEAGGGAFSNGENGANPFVFVPAAGDGGVVVFNGGIGLYAGEAGGTYGYGAGAYVNITSVAGCH